MKYLIIAVLILICVILALVCVRFFVYRSQGAAGQLELLDSFETGKLYRAGKVNVLELRGSYKEMGKQYGKLMNAEINAAYEILINGFLIKEKELPEKDVKDFAAKQFEYYPERLKEIVYGMDETSTLDASEIIVLNSFYDLLLKYKISQCSMVGVWGESTSGGSLILGRNFDLGGKFRANNNLVSLVAFNPTDGSRSAAIITYAGMITAPQSFNDAGLVSVNDAANGFVGGISDFEMTPFVVNALQFLLDNASLRSLSSAVKTSRTSSLAILGVADLNEMHVYEVSSTETRRLENAANKGFIVATNHFVDLVWALPEPRVEEDVIKSVERRNNLIEIVKKNKGKFDAALMRKTLDIRIDERGARMMGTVYQFVYEPKDLVLWLKELEYQDWTRIDLLPLFSGKTENTKK